MTQQFFEKATDILQESSKPRSVRAMHGTLMSQYVDTLINFVTCSINYQFAWFAIAIVTIIYFCRIQIILYFILIVIDVSTFNRTYGYIWIKSWILLSNKCSK